MAQCLAFPPVTPPPVAAPPPKAYGAARSWCIYVAGLSAGRGRSVALAGHGRIIRGTLSGYAGWIDLHFPLDGVDCPAYKGDTKRRQAIQPFGVFPMNAAEIIAAIVEMHKDATFAEVKELLESRAMVVDLPFIQTALAAHVSSNEQNAASYAVSLIEGW